MMLMSYWRFPAMIATSTVVMYGLMYMNTYALEHVSGARRALGMALVMGATMSIIMLGYMLNMYNKRSVNIAFSAARSLSLRSPCGWCAARSR